MRLLDIRSFRSVPHNNAVGKQKVDNIIIEERDATSERGGRKKT